MMPWVARDLMQWPVSIPGDGLIDVVVQSVVPRLTMANAIAGAEKGETYWIDCQYYYKGVCVLFGWVSISTRLTGEQCHSLSQRT